jgi:hypothetical protein
MALVRYTLQKKLKKQRLLQVLSYLFLSWSQNMRIVPVNFNKEHKAMLGHCKMILEHEPRKIAINPDRFDKLITSLRTAVDIDGTLDKEATSYNDIFDAFRLALKFYRFREKYD